MSLGIYIGYMSLGIYRVYVISIGYMSLGMHVCVPVISVDIICFSFLNSSRTTELS